MMLAHFELSSELCYELPSSQTIRLEYIEFGSQISE